ncbi:MAG TPA: hypothetical protein VFF27_06885 [Bacteroidia bacterium]|jgi:hypothetical protein|nr:hypothetical protein [Bacteroidia bacterium]
MKKIKVLLIISLASFSFSLVAQDTTHFQLLKSIASQADFFTTDNQSNVYTVKANVLTKYDKTGKQLYKYSNKNFGNISFVDASNMLKVLVFYKSYLIAVFLDNTLSQNGDPISFDKLGFIQTQLVCSSNNSSMWIYDQQNLQLVRLDQNLTPTQKTGNLSVLLGVNLQPDALLEYDNKVYLNSPGTGILIFDIYGTYYKTIPIKDVRQFQPFNGRVFFSRGTDIQAYDLKTSEETQYEIPLKDFKNFRLEMGVLALQKDSIIQLFAPRGE